MGGWEQGYRGASLPGFGQGVSRRRERHVGIKLCVDYLGDARECLGLLWLGDYWMTSVQERLRASCVCFRLNCALKWIFYLCVRNVTGAYRNMSSNNISLVRICTNFSLFFSGTASDATGFGVYGANLFIHTRQGLVCIVQRSAPQPAIGRYPILVSYQYQNLNYIFKYIRDILLRFVFTCCMS